MRIFPKLLFLMLIVASLVGCASVDFDSPKIDSHAFQSTGSTQLGKLIEPLVAAHPVDHSGFFTLTDGIDAFSARLLMAERAEQSIDAQYYLIKDGFTGRAFILALLHAADRGVRVRLLVDDIFAGGYDAGMAGLDSHPNFEIRVWNPFARRSLRFIDGITNLRRLNRRMHNKSFTVDNQVTLIGGRNISDEYFGANRDEKFSDLDVVAIGPVVHDVSIMFDSYWNHERAAPIAAFVKMPENPVAELERVRKTLEQNRQEITSIVYAEVLDDQVLEYIDDVDDKDISFIWAPYTLTFDSPDKSFKSKAREADSIMTPLRESLLAAKSEILIISPYFVPRRSGVEAFSEVQARGIQVTVITNSLASSNQLVVHGGYAPSRKPLLKNGVKIYEMRDDADVRGAQLVAASGAKATLHTKAFIIDRKEIFIGSFNFDPRSAYINTELGVIIRSPEIAGPLADKVDAALAEQTWELFLENDRLRWRGYDDDGNEIIEKREPQTSWWTRFKAGFARILPIRGQL